MSLNAYVKVVGLRNQLFMVSVSGIGMVRYLLMIAVTVVTLFITSNMLFGC